MITELKHIVTTVFGVTIFMFLALSAVAILSSGKTSDSAIKSIGGSVPGSASESVLQELPQPVGPDGAPKGETLAAVTERPHT